TAGVVVGHHLIIRMNAARPQMRGEFVRVGQWMTPVAAVARAGKIVVEMQKQRAGDVALGVSAAAGPGVGEIVAAVDDAQAGLADMRGQRSGVDKRGPVHATGSSSGVSSQARASLSSLKTITSASTKNWLSHALQVTH